MRSIIAIQEGQITLDQIKQLEAALRKVYAELVGPHKLTVIWNVAAAKHTVTDLQWSRSSACSISVPDGFTLDKRQGFLLELDRQWREITGQHPDQTSFSAFDEESYKEVLKGNLARFSLLGRVSFLAKTAFRALRSKRRNGVLISHFNQ